jgi:hypothetical protein
MLSYRATETNLESRTLFWSFDISQVVSSLFQKISMPSLGQIGVAILKLLMMTFRLCSEVRQLQAGWAGKQIIWD